MEVNVSLFMTHPIIRIPNFGIPIFFSRKPVSLRLLCSIYMEAREIKMQHRTDLISHHAMAEISIKLLINKEKKQVVFAEAESDFIDVMFSFFTLPLGSIVQLLGKQSGLGSLDSLYKSVEQLDVKHLQTEACKEMLLNPRSEAARICVDGCFTQSTCYCSYVTKARCSRCGKLMDKALSWPKSIVENKGIFVNDGASFIITDDLRMMPISYINVLSVLEELRINDTSILEERVINVGNKEALSLLRRSLESKHALTEVFFPDSCVELSGKCFSMIKEKIDDTKAGQKFNLKIILNKKNSSVLFAEVGGDFLNQLLSFLTFPLGSVIRLLCNHISSECCINNLYFSAECLGLECFKSKECKNMLVFPQLASHYGCKSLQYTPCTHGFREAKVIEQNPKLRNRKKTNDAGRSFVEDSKRFMITDNLHISPISSISFIITRGIDFLFCDVVEKEIIVDKAKVLSLLGVMLISKTVLTDVFAPKRKQRSICYYMLLGIFWGFFASSVLLFCYWCCWLFGLVEGISFDV